MTRAGGLNLLVLCAALATSVAVVGSAHTGGPSARQVAEGTQTTAQTTVTDARGHQVAVMDYERIVSASIVADDILWQLCDPRRIAAYTSRATGHPRFAHRYAGKPGLPGLGEIEQVLSLRPDLVIMSHFADARYIARLEQHGIAVFDLGEMQGAESLLDDIRDIAALIGNREGGERLARRFADRLARVAADVPHADRPGALYLSVYGTKLFGGTRGTSYHDVLVSAGLRDVAAASHQGWPELDAETVLSLDPQLVITKRGMGPAICSYPGLQQLGACQHPGAIVGVTDVLIDDPGLPMLEAAEELHEAIYGRGGPLEIAGRATAR